MVERIFRYLEFPQHCFCCKIAQKACYLFPVSLAIYLFPTLVDAHFLASKPPMCRSSITICFVAVWRQLPEKLFFVHAFIKNKSMSLKFLIGHEKVTKDQKQKAQGCLIASSPPSSNDSQLSAPQRIREESITSLQTARAALCQGRWSWLTPLID